MKTKVVSKAILLNARGEVLLLRRSGTDPRRPGEWDFPGGAVEAGEEINDGMAREILEETSIKVEPARLSLLFAATEAYKTESVTRLLFCTRAGEVSVRLSFEHDRFEWVSADTALKRFPHPFYGAGLAYARDHDLL